MTSKPDSVSTLGYHWTDHTGRPLEPQVHWDATGTTLADASTQWCSSGDPVLICIIGTHWKTTGKPLQDHWKTTGSTLAFLQWHSSVHWGLSSRHTGLPLEDHWLRVRDVTHLMSKLLLVSPRPILLTSLNLFPSCISNHMLSKLWAAVTYPFPNFNYNAMLITLMPLMRRLLSDISLQCRHLNG